ncbi:DNA polymerase III subunit delta' [Ornithinimicrobium tianjinense]|uniref:DNA polymerase III subunit delta n=1 Tax=Ornithinimicrobium tianjinense TaxID=1195761 RepID=A0A917F086_9MICO|nr:DNA polymerase III subunit delta' [Ornithinimicrobium tianjinense]GGF37614.1 DNA polymerase III subunit delta [Ornithinimicrobium tianjinense]
MSVFDQLVGQQQVVATLRRTLTTPGAMTHAWLVTGPPGSGRSVAARAFAAALQCERVDDPGCGQCQACRTAMAGSHPDVQVVTTTETFIKVEAARDLAVDAQARPTLGRWRVIVVEDADRFTEQAADALLKSLEEPPPRTVWILCAPSLEDLIVTVRSRCRHLRLGTPPVSAVADLLIERDGIDPSMAYHAARAAQSHIGIARRLATDEHARARRREVTSIPLRLTSLGAALNAAQDLVSEAGEGAESVSSDRHEAERRALLEQLGADPAARVQPPAVRTHLRDLEARQKRQTKRQQHDSIDAALTDLASVYRDALLVSSGARVELVNASEPDAIGRLARAFSQDGLLEALETIGLARQRLIANGAPLLVLEAMMIGLTIPTSGPGVGHARPGLHA